MDLFLVYTYVVPGEKLNWYLKPKLVSNAHCEINNEVGLYWEFY